VRADHDAEGAAVEVEIDVLDEGTARTAIGDVSGFDTRAHRDNPPGRRSRSQRKNGAPMAAVRMPMGSSAGATTVRANVSAQTSRAAPSRAEAGSSIRWSGPAMRRS